MSNTIEIKAQVRDWAGVKNSIEKFYTAPGVSIFQEDLYFNSPKGRLKLRFQPYNLSQLIYYERNDFNSVLQRSEYRVYRTTDPDSLKLLLAASWGIKGVVRKQRSLYLIGNVCIHLDVVEGIGRFVEIEVVLSDGINERVGIETASAYMARLGIVQSDIVKTAYIDLVSSRKN